MVKSSLHTSLSGRSKVNLARNIRTLSLASQGLFNRLLVSRSGAASAAKLSPIAAAMQLQNAYHRVPAYADFLSNHDWRIVRSATLPAVLNQLPETDKISYINAYTLAERCSGGVIPLKDAEIDESSGSSGKPYNWLRGKTELTQMRRTLSRLATFLYGPNIVTINGFSMGAWATGTNVSMSLVRNGLIKSTGPDAEKMLSVFQMVGPGRTFVVTGYPPFLLELLEYGKKRGFDWSKYHMVGIVGGEAMSETLRSRLLEHFTTIQSAYGASDLDIGVACEFPLSTWIRQQAQANPKLAHALFGEARRLPMLFQYDPLDYYVEQNDQQELIVTVNRPSALSPRLRYNVHDNGGRFDFDVVIAICKQFGLDPFKDAPLPFAGVHPQLPFLYIGGRSDSTISYLGANIYPEDVEQALFADAPASEKGVIKGFAMELVENNHGQPHPFIYVELQEGRNLKTLDVKVLSKRIVDRLIINSRDFKTSITEDPKAGNVEVHLYKPNTGPFEGMNDRIKRRYIITKPAK